jgi:hypothetical protein
MAVYHTSSSQTAVPRNRMAAARSAMAPEVNDEKA